MGRKCVESNGPKNQKRAEPPTLPKSREGSRAQSEPSGKAGATRLPSMTNYSEREHPPASGGVFRRDPRIADSVLERLLLYSCSFDDDLWVLYLIPDIDGVFE